MIPLTDGGTGAACRTLGRAADPVVLDRSGESPAEPFFIGNRVPGESQPPW